MRKREVTKYYRQLAEKYGWQLQWTRRGHPEFVRDGFKTVYGSGTPSDWRSVHNIEAKLKRPKVWDERET